MDSEIRQATIDDAAEIVRVNNTVFPDVATTVEQTTAVFRTNTHATQVAVINGRIAGFVDGFATPKGSSPVWNVDLLAVHPDFQGYGLGKRLIAANWAAGQQHASKGRALIQTENVASQRAFAACGFGVETAVCTLLAQAISAPPITVNLTPPCAVAVVPVETIGYSGAWLEMDDDVVETAVSLQISHPAVGIVISNSQRNYLDSAKTAGFDPVSTYQWWTICAF